MYKSAWNKMSEWLRFCLSVIWSFTYIHTSLYLPSDFRVAYAGNISEHLTIRWETTPGTTYPTVFKQCMGSSTSHRINYEELWDGAYGLSSLSEKTGKYIWRCHYMSFNEHPKFLKLKKNYGLRAYFPGERTSFTVQFEDSNKCSLKMSQSLLVCQHGKHWTHTVYDKASLTFNSCQSASCL